MFLVSLTLKLTKWQEMVMKDFVKRKRKPTRCNNQMFIINTVSTCFGHHYDHLQENKDCVLLHVVCCAGSDGCGW